MILVDLIHVAGPILSLVTIVLVLVLPVTLPVVVSVVYTTVVVTVAVGIVVTGVVRPVVHITAVVVVNVRIALSFRSWAIVVVEWSLILLVVKWATHTITNWTSWPLNWSPRVHTDAIPSRNTRAMNKTRA